MSNTTYFEKEGKWYKQTFAEQCGEQVFFGDKCQGVKGHKGEHWAYSADGSYRYAVPKEELTHRWRGAAGMTPPGHEKYIHPASKSKEYYLRHSTVEEVTDPKLIEKLENDDFSDDEVAIDRPVNLNTLPEDLKRDLEDYDKYWGSEEAKKDEERETEELKKILKQHYDYIELLKKLVEKIEEKIK